MAWTAYRTALGHFERDLERLPRCGSHYQAFVRVVGEVIKLCFFHCFDNVEPRCRDVDGRVIRDWIACNVADHGFWGGMRHRYGAYQVIWECKNYDELSAA